MSDILTVDEVREAIYADEDFSLSTLQRYARSASSFLKVKTGYDFSEDAEIEPLAKECAMKYVQQLHFGSQGYNEKYDFNLGINSMLKDLQVIANDKKSAQG